MTKSSDIKQHHKHPDLHSGSTRRLIVANVPTISISAKAGDIERLLLKETKNFETIDYIYVVDSRRRLKGVVSIKEVFRTSKQTPIKSLMTANPVSVRPHTDQERAAMLALKHNIKAVPIIDKNKTFLGIVTSDAILAIIHAEGVENVLRFGGIFHHRLFDDIFHLPLITSLKHRLPWLIIGLFAGIAVAGMVNAFDRVISRNLILAAFIPLIVYMGDAVGTQLEAFIIRDLAVDPQLKFFKYFFRHSLVVLILGGLVSFAAFGISLALYHSQNVSLILSFSLFFAIISSLVTGLTVPYVFGKLRLDPANASGPIATIIQDTLSVAIYFSIASALLS